jgi:ribonuclease VapC
MIIDSSALLALVLNEPDGKLFARAIASAERPRLSAVNWFEATLLIDRKGDAVAASRFGDFITEFGIEVIQFTPEHARRARQARGIYGKGQHPAKLNFGDCMAYATAKIEGAPLLFKGNDFAQTDIEPALKD